MCASQIARKVISSFRQKDALSEATLLTTREKEILKALAKGLRYKEVADEMAIGIETVRTHIRHIYEKLQVSSRTEALNKFYRKELFIDKILRKKVVFGQISQGKVVFG